MKDVQKEGTVKMNLKGLGIDPWEDEWSEIRLSDEVAIAYSLDKWGATFSLMTAGYRDQLNPVDASDPDVAFNTLIIAILGEAKARVFERKCRLGMQLHVHVGGETRPHTQIFIAFLSRVYAAHGMKVHLRAHVNTTPIWYSSFGVFYEEYQSGDNLTASHSPFFKGGWKPIDSTGKQLLEEEAEIISEVRNIIANRQCIRLAPWRADGMISSDFDIDLPYGKYLRSVVTDRSIDDINKAVQNGFRFAACTVGGSMKATTERLFPLIGIPTGVDGVVQYLFGEEDPQYHNIGVFGGENFGPDPSKMEVYKFIGAQKILLDGRVSIVVIWDPDGDRFNIITVATSEQAKEAIALGLEVDSCPGSDMSIVYFTPNQLFFMLTAYRIGILKETGLLKAYDWFIAPSISTSRSIGELAAHENIPVVYVRVGFKYMGTFSEWLENRGDSNAPFTNAICDKIRLGKKPRALIMCEESGGAVFGGTDLLMNKSRSKGLIALREKDGMQFGLMSLSLAATLYNSKRTFAEYYCSLMKQFNIQNRFFNREDVRLYDESLTGEARDKAKSAGIVKRDRIMDFFLELPKMASSGTSLEEIRNIINSKRHNKDCLEIPTPQRVSSVGEGTILEGTLFEFDGFWVLIRASGTDALIRYYIEGSDKNQIGSYQQAFIHLRI